MGGIQYFNVSVETPEGDMALLEKVLEGANAPVDEAAEERKGGAGDIGKFLLSAGETQLVGIGHVPKALAEAKGLTVKVRGAHQYALSLPRSPAHSNVCLQLSRCPVLHSGALTGARTRGAAPDHSPLAARPLSRSPYSTLCPPAPHCSLQEWATKLLEFLPGGKITEETDEIVKIVMPANTDQNVFPLKARDAAIDGGFKLLKAKGLVPDTAEDSDDDVNYAEAAGVEW